MSDVCLSGPPYLVDLSNMENTKSPPCRFPPIKASKCDLELFDTAHKRKKKYVIKKVEFRGNLEDVTDPLSKSYPMMKFNFTNRGVNSDLLQSLNNNEVSTQQKMKVKKRTSDLTFGLLPKLETRISKERIFIQVKTKPTYISRPYYGRHRSDRAQSHHGGQVSNIS